MKRTKLNGLKFTAPPDATIFTVERKAGALFVTWDKGRSIVQYDERTVNLNFAVKAWIPCPGQRMKKKQSNRKSIKERLAEKVNAELNLPVTFQAEDFEVNKGSNRFNDWCCWTARSGNVQICSWETMTALATRKESLFLIGSRTEIGPIEIA